MNKKDVLINLGKSIMEYIEDNYPQGRFALAIDPDIWNVCIDAAGLNENSVETAVQDLRVAQYFVSNRYVALALAAFQVQLFNEKESMDESSFNRYLKERLKIEDNVIECYYKLNYGGREQTFQETIFNNAKNLLKEKGYVVEYPDKPIIGRSDCYIKFPRSQSLWNLVGYSRKDPINFFAEKWVKDYGWTRNDSLNEGFRTLFDEKMNLLVRCKYELYGNDPETDRKLNLVLSCLYGYFSNVWNGTYPDSETGMYENVQTNDYTIEQLKIYDGLASFELWKNDEKINYIPKTILYSEKKRNSVFFIDDRYDGYARLERDTLNLEKCKGEKCIILAPLNGLRNLPENVEVYKADGYSGYRLFFIDEIDEEIVHFFNLKAGKPFFEFIGGVRVKRDLEKRESQNFEWFDFAIPRLKINSSKDMLFVNSPNDSFSIDGDKLEKEIDLSNLKRDVEYRFHLEKARKSVNFKIVSADNYPKEKMPENAGWVIERNRIDIVQGPCKKNESRIKGLEGVNMDDDPCSPIMRHLKRFEFVKKIVENNQIEKRRKYVC